MQTRQSTAVAVEVGPILNEDGTPYVTDDLTRADFRITKAGTSGALNAAATVAHVVGDLQGMFLVTLTADDTDTLGSIAVTPNKATLAGFPWRGNVLTQAAWDALHTAADGRIRSDLDKIKDQTVTCGAAVTIHPAVGADHKPGVNSSGHVSRVALVDTTTANSDMRGTDGAAQPGDEMELTAAQVIALVAAIEAEIADDATGEAVKQAIIDKLIENLPDLDELSLAAIAQAVWDRLTSALMTGGSIGKMLVDRINDTITSRHAAGAAVAKSPATLDWDADVSNPPTIGTSTFNPATDEVITDTASRNASKATGFATPTDVSNAAAAIILHGDGSWLTGNTTTPPTVEEIATQVQTELAATEVDTDVSFIKILEMICAAFSGKLTAVENDGVVTLTYYKRDNTTISFTTLANEADGSRNEAGNL